MSIPSYSPVHGTLRALAVAFPETVRHNAWWEDHHPTLVTEARESTLARLWANHREPRRGEMWTAADLYDEAIAPYLHDPFRGAVERRVMGPKDSAQSLCARAMRGTLEAADIDPASVDLILVSALRPDSHIVGDAAFLVRELGLQAPAIDFESACSSAVVGFHLACDLVAAGRYHRILVVSCCTYTRDVDHSDSLSWFLGDGAAAFLVEGIVGRQDEEGLLGAHTIPTVETCGAFAYELSVVGDAAGLRLICDESTAGRSIRDHSARYLLRCVDEATREAGVSTSEIDFLVCNTPTAWYGRFCASVLGFDRDRFVDNFPRFGNCGPALWPSNLHTAVARGHVRPGALVLGYSIGSVSTASAVVFRIGQVAIGPDP